MVVAITSVGMIGCATALAGGPAEVRVLIYDSTDPVPIGSPKKTEKVRASHDNLLIGERSLGRVWAPKGSGPWRVGSRTVRGRIAVRAKKGRVQVLNRVELEAYVASTVGGEMSPSWPREALRAQAVAARTYVLHEAGKRRKSDWDVKATVASQVYRGIAAESKETRSAAHATRGEVLTYRGKPILAVFHSTAGGRTATAGEVWGQDLPYLTVVEVQEEDDAPHTYWRTEFSTEGLSKVLEAAGVQVSGLQAVAVTRRTASGRVERITFRGKTCAVELSESSLKGLISSLGLRSTLFDVRSTTDGFAFVGSGFGHGVGMSQWGARSLAERGESYQRILARFYPGTRLENWKSRRVAASKSSMEETRDGFPRGEMR